MADLYTNGDYLKKNPTWHVDESPWKATEIRRMLARNNLTPKSICEVGCGAGEILRLLQSSLHSESTFVGYDISPQAIELARERANDRLRFYQGDLAQEENTFFDLILVMDVLEHMEDCFTFLRTIHPKSQYKILQLPMDVSVKSVLLGRINMYREQYGHIHYFTKELAFQMLKEQGYELLDYFYTEKFVERPHKPDNTNGLLHLKKSIGRSKRALLKLPRRLTFAANPDLAVRIFGEWRLLILVR